MSIKDDPNNPHKSIGETVKDDIKKVPEVVKKVTGSSSGGGGGETTKDKEIIDKKNFMLLIKYSYLFMGFLVLMLSFMSAYRESIIDKILPVFTLILGGILTFIAKDIINAMRGGGGNS